MNEIQVIQTALTYARQREGFRKVDKFSAQRLERDAWGVFVEGINRSGEAITLRLRIDANGNMAKC